MSLLNEESLRKAYAAFARGDLEGYLGYCMNDITFRVPGRSAMAGTYTREQFFSPFIGRVMELTNGSFKETVIDVLANDRRGVVLAEHEFERNGRKHVYRTAHLYRIHDGKLTDFQEYPEDLYAFDEAWK